MMLITRTATNLHVLDGGIAWVHRTTILDYRNQHEKPCAAAVNALVWHHVHGALQEGLVLTHPAAV